MWKKKIKQYIKKVGSMKKIKTSLVLNIIIVLLVTVGSIFMFTGIKFMPDNTLLESSKIGMFKFYTVDSNILVGISSLLLIAYEVKYLKNKITEIPQVIYILKFVGTAAITLTFLTTALFLVPQYGLYAMYSNNNLFFHLIVPLLAIVSYVLFENHDSKYTHAIYGIVPMFLYCIYYTSMICLNLDNGGLTYKYDFYGFLRGNINNIFIVIPTIFLVSYMISIVLIFLNKKSKK